MDNREIKFRAWDLLELKTNEGLFHQWGCSYEEFESGAGNFTVAIVELTDGTIEQVLPSNLKFVDLP